jgi:hypothetical protein
MMLPNANDETTGHATAQATATTGRSDHRDDHAIESGALPTGGDTASAPAPTATDAEAPGPIGAGVEMRLRHAPGLAAPSAGAYFGEDSKTALAAQAVLLKQMSATADDAPRLQGIDLPADAVVAVATAARGTGAEQAGNTDDAPDHSDAR